MLPNNTYLKKIGSLFYLLMGSINQCWSIDENTNRVQRVPITQEIVDAEPQVFDGAIEGLIENALAFAKNAPSVEELTIAKALVCDNVYGSEN